MSAASRPRVQVLNLPEEESDELKITPLGSGQEVGRSCHFLEFKGKKVLLDFGIHPALTGMSALPFSDFIDPEQIDLMLVSHFHLDHAGGLPWFLMRTKFKGRCYMTHPTKAIYKWLLSDYIKVSNIATEHMLYSEHDLELSLNKINVINFHEEKEVQGIKFWCYHAGHVLGAAMFMIQIAGVKILYTGDFSRQEDRHLMMAEIPQIRPDVLMIESTYGVSIHEPRESRESRFTSTVHTIVTRGGRCLIPVFALGRAQELLLILDEYWQLHPELHEVPIYYASALAKKCMSVYQTYTHAMNERIQRQISISNPFQFKHISNLKGMDQFEDIGPCVIMASPGMMQSGLSRELFEIWCPDPKNGVIIAGYCVEGTLAKEILKEPEEVTTMSGQRLPMKCSVEYISFSAHTDFEQTTHFIRTIHPPNVVLVHGEMTEMSRLKSALEREYETAESPIKVFNPKNLETVTFHFRGEKMAKVMGELATLRPKENDIVSGILVKRNFNCHIISPKDLGKYSELSVSSISQRSSLHYTGSWPLLHYLLTSMYGTVEVLVTDAGENQALKVFDAVTIIHEPPVVVLEWVASPASDMYADAVMKVVLKAQQLEAKDVTPPALSSAAFDRMHFKECLIELFQEMFGEDSVPKIFKGEKLYVAVNSVRAYVDLVGLKVTSENEKLERVVQTAVTKLFQSLAPVSTAIKG
ncbi:cleavage and polyadenylation specificity factor subunit 3-like [Eriocheir sinensis]|uniref:cleavage and polyadenylation specificity factor subunit 3-like n=1 Tax=Eriocheir sinensis TaxID=95602 RepID=UPI0021C896A7|nr:cleavage and polyadenylation specificity factor subunit 3-like [Eriocheir sinensis]